MAKRKWSHLRAPAMLALWREQKGWTSARMAEEIHVDPATYSKFEGHIARPGIDIASQIERVTEGAVRASYWEDSKP